MKKKENIDDLWDSINPVIQGLGFRVADVSTRRARGIFEVHLVLAKPGGITLDDCAAVHTTVLPKLELEYPDTDIHLEVASPGINRVIKWVTELPAYIGMTITVLPIETDSWIRGTLRDITDSVLMLETQEGNKEYHIDTIRKAKLEGMEEAKK